MLSKYFKSGGVDKIFYLFCLAYVLFCAVFQLSPSSYGAALDMLGIEYSSMLGEARAVRSDEWAVWTPYTQMAVNNDFQRYYDLGEYRVDMRNFNQIPLLDWMLPFKPLTWGYFVFSAATGFAIFYAGMAVLFLTGWKRLAAKFVGDKDPTGLVPILFALLMYFTGASQYWWTTVGPILAFSPWLILSLLDTGRFRYFFVFYASAVWLLSHTYPPIIVSVAFFGLVCIFYFRYPFDKASLVDLFIKLIAVLVALALVIGYYFDNINVMMQTVYPGQRFSVGADVSWMLWLTSIFPFALQSNFDSLVLQNICEIATGGSYLLLLACCFAKFSKQGIKSAAPFLLVAALFSVWMLFGFPASLAKITLLSNVPGSRMVFALGMLLNIAALVYLVKSEVIITPGRLAVFAVLLLGCYSLSALAGLDGWFDKSAWELLLLPSVALIWAVKRYEKVLLLLSALIVNMFYTFSFNPVLRSDVIFFAQNTPAFQYAKERMLENASGWKVASYPGAVLTGLGIKSFSTVLIQPQLAFFRSLYPEMEQGVFNGIFNRYAHIHVTEQVEFPDVPQPDVIRLPLTDVCSECVREIPLKTQLPELAGQSLDNVGGSIDVVTAADGAITLTGWLMSEENELYILDYAGEEPLMRRIERPDVARALQDHALALSGFKLVLDEQQSKNVCLISHSPKYGYRKLPDHERFDNCKNLPD